MYLRDGTYLKVTKELKHDILEELAETMYAFDAYPAKRDYEAVAKAFVETHSCLKESGSSSGWDGWKNSLKFKMGNYRTKMRQLGRLMSLSTVVNMEDTVHMPPLPTKPSRNQGRGKLTPYLNI